MAKDFDKRSSPFGVDAPMTVGTTQTRSKATRSQGSFDLDITEYRGPDECLEARIKDGSTGLELLAFVKSQYDCSEEEAFDHIKRVVGRSADMIRKTFSTDQCLIMAFKLYYRAVDKGSIREAAEVLQRILNLVNQSGMSHASESRPAVQVKILELLADNEADSSTYLEPQSS